MLTKMLYYSIKLNLDKFNFGLKNMYKEHRWKVRVTRWTNIFFTVNTQSFDEKTIAHHTHRMYACVSVDNAPLETHKIFDH